jgi:hypothetical protein
VFQKHFGAESSAAAEKLYEGVDRLSIGTQGRGRPIAFLVLLRTSSEASAPLVTLLPLSELSTRDRADLLERFSKGVAFVTIAEPTSREDALGPVGRNVLMGLFLNDRTSPIIVALPQQEHQQKPPHRPIMMLAADPSGLFFEGYGSVC